MTSKFHLTRDKNGAINGLVTNQSGHDLLDNPRLNKGSAFTQSERELFSLAGKLPYHVETIEDQVERTYEQYLSFSSDLSKNIYLNTLHDTNETLFYRLVSEHIEEMLPIIYTPTIGEAVQKFSLELRRPRGIYIAYPDMDRMDEIIANRANYLIDIIVVTDGEGVLGIGDQGIGGMNICIGKLMCYVLCAGVNPLKKLAVTLDVGTNNQHLLNDPMYIGWRHERISQEQYDEFIEKFVTCIRKHLSTAFLHWEDFGRENARRYLDRYRDQFCTFNDDVQGTGAVTLAAILAGIHTAGSSILDQRIVFFGAGTAGTGIADQLYAAMIRQGASEQDARKCFYLIDRQGILVDDMKGLTPFQKPYARSLEEIAQWEFDGDNPDLLAVINNIKPTILIGCSAVSGAFNEQVVTAMASYVERPIILPLSNPTSHAEAHPANLYKWTNGKALVATGSPFGEVNYEGEKIRVAQSNNAFIFPGLGLGVIACRPQLLTDKMIWAAAEALSKCSPAFVDPSAPLLPDLSEIKTISYKVAAAVVNQARREKLDTFQCELTPEEAIKHVAWKAEYYPYSKCS